MKHFCNASIVEDDDRTRHIIVATQQHNIVDLTLHQFQFEFLAFWMAFAFSIWLRLRVNRKTESKSKAKWHHQSHSDGDRSMCGETIRFNGILIFRMAIDIKYGTRCDTSRTIFALLHRHDGLSTHTHIAELLLYHRHMCALSTRYRKMVWCATSDAQVRSTSLHYWLHSCTP